MDQLLKEAAPLLELLNILILPAMHMLIKISTQLATITATQVAHDLRLQLLERAREHG